MAKSKTYAALTVAGALLAAGAANAQTAFVNQGGAATSDADAAASAAASAKIGDVTVKQKDPVVTAPAQPRFALDGSNRVCVVRQDFKNVRYHGQTTKVAAGEPYWVISAATVKNGVGAAASIAGVIGVSGDMGGASIKFPEGRPSADVANVMCGGAPVVIVTKPAPVAAAPAPTPAPQAAPVTNISYNYNLQLIAAPAAPVEKKKVSRPVAKKKSACSCLTKK